MYTTLYATPRGRIRLRAVVSNVQGPLFDNLPSSSNDTSHTKHRRLISNTTKPSLVRQTVYMTAACMPLPYKPDFNNPKLRLSAAGLSLTHESAVLDREEVNRSILGFLVASLRAGLSLMSYG